MKDNIIFRDQNGRFTFFLPVAKKTTLAMLRGKAHILRLAVLMAMGGCAPLNNDGTTPAKSLGSVEDVSLHAVIAHKDGLPVRATVVDKKVSFSPPMTEDENKQYLTDMINNIKAKAPTRDGKRQILIFIHGGMNEKKGTVLRTQELGKIPSLKEKYYPICIDWNSAPLSTYTEHLFFVRRGSRHPEEGILTSPVLLASDVARGISRAPLVWGNLAFSVADQPGGFNYPYRRAVVAQEAIKERRRLKHTGPTVSNMTVVDGDRRTFAQSTLPGIHTLFFIPKAVTATLIDIIGTGAWDMMLRRSEELFRSPTFGKNLHPEDEKKIDELTQLVKDKKNRTPEEKERIRSIVAELNEGQKESPRLASEYLNRSRPGAVEQFLRALETQLGPDAADRYSITLVGHSMGSIVSNEMISSHPRLPFDHIIYMAAACSVNECVKSVAPYLERNPNAQFYNLSLHPIMEVSESNPSLPTKIGATPVDLVGGTFGLMVPRGSLLVWLDDFFTKPVSLEERRMGKWNTAVTEVNLFPEKLQSRIHLKMFEAGPKNVPQKHGALASEGMGFWMDEFRKP